MKIKIMGLVFLMLAVMVAGAWGEIPKMISFQGKISPRPAEGSGITFRIGTTYSEDYNVTHTPPGGGVNLYIREDGLFSVNIGGNTVGGISPTHFDGPKSLSIRIIEGSTTTDLPAQPLASVPYAYRALVAESVEGGISWPLTGNLNTTGSLINLTNTTTDGYGLQAGVISGTAVEGTGKVGVHGYGTITSSVSESDLDGDNPKAGVLGHGHNMPGVVAKSENHYSIYAYNTSTNKAAIKAKGNLFGIYGEGSQYGVMGKNSVSNAFGYLGQGNMGLYGMSSASDGVGMQASASNIGGLILGYNTTQAGSLVEGSTEIENTNGLGDLNLPSSPARGALFVRNMSGTGNGDAIIGVAANAGEGVEGISKTGYGVKGLSYDNSFGVYGKSFKGLDGCGVRGRAEQGYGGYFTTGNHTSKAGLYADSARIGSATYAPQIKTRVFMANFEEVMPLDEYVAKMADPLDPELLVFKTNMDLVKTFDLQDPDGAARVLSISRLIGIQFNDDIFLEQDIADGEVGVQVSASDIGSKISVRREKSRPFVKSVKMLVIYSVMPLMQFTPLVSGITSDFNQTPPGPEPAATGPLVPTGNSLPATANDGDMFYLTPGTTAQPKGLYVYLGGLSWHRTTVDVDLTWNKILNKPTFGTLAGMNSVGTAQIADGAVQNDQLASSGLSASKFTTGTLPNARLSSAVMVAPLDSSGNHKLNTSIILSPNNTGATGIGFNDSSGNQKVALAYFPAASRFGMTVNGAWALQSDGNNLYTNTLQTINLKSVYARTAISTVTFIGTSSDLRLKSDIAPIGPSLDKVAALRGVSYKWKDAAAKNLPTTNQLGLIAQEVEKVAPELVSDDQDGYKQLNYNGMSALFVEAIKELKAENEQLKARLKALEDKVR